MKIEASKRMDQFSESIFGQLNTATVKKAESGAKVYDLSLGSPDLAPDSRIRETLSKESKREHVYGYTAGGIEDFNQAVVDYYKRRSNVTLDPETEIIQTAGSQEGIIHLPSAFCDEGDIVLTTDPAYLAYDAGYKLAGAEPYYMPLRQENDYLPVLEDIPEEVAEKAKLMVLNLPGNPVPAMPTPYFFEDVVAFAKKHNILVLHDAAYSEFYFTGNEPITFLKTPGAKEVGIEINSLSKSFNLAGARIAYIVGNQKAIEIMADFKSNLDYGIFEPIQKAAATALNHAESITDDLRHIYAERHRVVTEGLEGLGWEVAPSQGGMFIWAKYPYEMDDYQFVLKSIEDSGVVMMPGTSFGSEGKGHVRIALVEPSDVLQEAIEALGTLDS